MRKRDKGDVFRGAALQRQEVEADVLEIWIVASRLLGRLTESSRPRIRRKTRPRGRIPRARKPTASRSVLIP